ncbi:MAG: hypothetical protein IJ756_08305 [Paludibacteraceae bacterium]|nr:hypothetical protein [Paludibacteraceae bacterium]
MPTVVNSGNMPQTEPTQNVNTQSVETTTSTPEQQENIASRIQVNQIVNQGVPIVVFVGPPASGKSMILVRLAKYLRTQGYTIRTDETFLNTEQYRNDCAEFNDKLNTNVALDGTVKYLLINVYKEGTEIAKLLEAPGEDFYDTDPTTARKNNNRVLPYLATIMTSANPKSYVMLLDLDSKVSFRNNSYHRDSYTDRFLKHFYPNIHGRRDRIILLYNKIDLTPFGTIHECRDEKAARHDAELYYPQLFATMKVKKFGGFATMDNFVFKTFCTGMFADEVDDHGKNIQTYNIANEIYPQILWQEITRKW